MKLPLKGYWDLLSRHIRPQRGRFTLLAVLLLGSIGLQIVNPQIMRSFIDAALGTGAAPANQSATLVVAALAFIGIAILQQVVSVGVTYLGESVAWTATNELRAELAWHCLNLDMGFHHEHTPGEMIERIDGDVAELARFFSQFGVTLLGNLLLMVGVLAALLREDWRAGVAFSVFAALALLALNRVRDIAMPHEKARRQAEADLFGFVEEQLSGTEDIRSSGAVGFSLRELFRFQGEILKHNRKASFKEWLIHMVVGGLIVLGNILAVSSGYFLYTAGAITIGTAYLFVHYLNLLEAPLWILTHEVQSFQTIGACVERLTELRRVEARVKDGVPGRVVLPEDQGAGGLGLAFEGVTFRYEKNEDRKKEETPQAAPSSSISPLASQPGPGTNGSGRNGKPGKNGGREVALEGVSFRLQAGRVLGLLGRTGSGKTTLARLVFRLYDPLEGRILLDGVRLADLPLQAVRGRVGLVTQDVQLFQASVRENLTFFDRGVPDARIWEALEELELADWIRSLPQGLDFRLETGGRSLSAGEAQLLAFTRVFLRNPGLVILDEASSRLDPATEARIERAIDRLLQGRTAIIIAHRLHTVHRADEILILEEGQVREWGDRQRLAADPQSRFSQLLQTGLEEVLA
jgi:ABC-type multidrug transport system fused ATPase/permease subunit